MHDYTMFSLVISVTTFTGIDSVREGGSAALKILPATNAKIWHQNCSIFAAIHARIHCQSVLLQTSREVVAQADVTAVTVLSHHITFLVV